MIHTLLPLNMYSVSYELAHGRPYSKLEELLLTAVHEISPIHGCTFSDLRNIFMVHDRLLTEALVTLIQEGWIAMLQDGNEMHYMVTGEGKITIESGRRPANLRVRTQRIRIVRERLAGQLIRASEIAMVTAAALRRTVKGPVWRRAVTPRIVRTKINAGEAERLLPRSDQRQEWIRWIDPAIRVSQDMHYLPIQVDLEAEKVFGLPPQWQNLVPLITAEVSERSGEFTENEEFQKFLRDLPQSSQGRRPSEPLDHYVKAEISCSDIGTDARESDAVTKEFLDSLCGDVFLVVNHLTDDTARRVKAVLAQLLAAGRNTDVLWSPKEDEDARPIQEVLQSARAGSKQARATFSRTSPDLTADLLLTTTHSGPAVLLGPALLTPLTDSAEPLVTGRVAGYEALTSLARMCADWWEDSTGDAASASCYRWRHTAERWAEEAVRGQTRRTNGVPCRNGHDACTGSLAVLTAAQLDSARQGKHMGVTRPGTPSARQRVYTSPGEWLVENLAGKALHLRITGHPAEERAVGVSFSGALAHDLS